ncbi:MlaD family protein [Spirulina subsalsa]|uniref:MlaD family protein n=1 Tax=Spirulina subsalsa TaxID=54311 RepID=UPI0008FB577B|nr:MlaD family protein [Spirulina subsalsa]
MRFIRNIAPTRLMREGALGLFILMGLIAFGGFSLWLRRLTIGQDSYRVNVRFDNSNGMNIGGAVRYRGVKVGSITRIVPTTNGIAVTLEITPTDLRIPKDVLIEANQSGLISETIIDISPRSVLVNAEELEKPLSRRCNAALIICHDDEMEGVIGVSLDDAMRSMIQIGDSLTNPELLGNVTELTANASKAAEEVAKLGTELTLLSRAVRGEIRGFSGAAQSVANVAESTTEQVNRTMREYQLTAVQLNRLVDSLNGAVVENRASVSQTLSSISRTSDRLSELAGTLNSTVATVQGRFDNVQIEELVQNLEQLTANSAEASANLRDMTQAFNDPANILALQRTLDSARATFENAQKITSDLDELTGNPEFRQNLLRLVNGLSGLVSSTEQLEQQIRTAQELEPVQQALEQAQLMTAPESPSAQSSSPSEPTLVAPRLSRPTPSAEPSPDAPRPLPAGPVIQGRRVNP